MKELNLQAVKHIFFSLSSITFRSFSKSDCKDTTFANIQKARLLFLTLFFSCRAKVVIIEQPAIVLVLLIKKSSPQRIKSNNLRRLRLSPKRRIRAIPILISSYQVLSRFTTQPVLVADQLPPHRGTCAVDSGFKGFSGFTYK